MLGGIGVPELIMIFVIILVLFGGKKLPEMGAGLGKAIRSFKEGMSGGGEGEKKADAEPVVRELPREETAVPAAPAADKEKAGEPVRKG